jgi:hypothetical protein
MRVCCATTLLNVCKGMSACLDFESSKLHSNSIILPVYVQSSSYPYMYNIILNRANSDRSLRGLGRKSEAMPAIDGDRPVLSAKYDFASSYTTRSMFAFDACVVWKLAPLADERNSFFIENPWRRLTRSSTC